MAKKNITRKYTNRITKNYKHQKSHKSGGGWPFKPQKKVKLAQGSKTFKKPQFRIGSLFGLRRSKSLTTPQIAKELITHAKTIENQKVAEAKRVANEEKRKANEEKRKANEEKRKANEQKRKEIEIKERNETISRESNPRYRENIQEVLKHMQFLEDNKGYLGSKLEELGTNKQLTSLMSNQGNIDINKIKGILYRFYTGEEVGDGKSITFSELDSTYDIFFKKFNESVTHYV
jgi:hypothetical protein